MTSSATLPLVKRGAGKTEHRFGRENIPPPCAELPTCRPMKHLDGSVHRVREHARGAAATAAASNSYPCAAGKMENPSKCWDSTPLSR